VAENLKSLTSEQLFERAKAVSPGGVHSPVRSFKGLGRAPIFFEKAQGPYLYSVEGKRYIDFCQSFGPLILGHRDPEVAEAVHAMIETAWSFGACEPYSLELAEWITSRIPFVQKLRFVSSGTEATMSVLRVARAATGRKKILKFEGCYHGHADALLVKAGSGLAGESASSSAGISAQVAAETLVAPLDDIETLKEIFQREGREIATVIFEPLPANYGLLIQSKEFIEQAVSLARKHGALVIFDEVISGFRVALGGMAELLGIEPDLVCYGKIIGGGFPVGCYGGKSEWMDLVAPSGDVYQAGTLSANPVGMKAGLITLKKMEREKGWSVLAQRMETFKKDLSPALEKSHLQMETFESLFWLHTPAPQKIRRIEQIPEGQAAAFKKIFLKCLEQGVYLAPNAYEVGFLSLAHDDQVLKEAGQVIGQALESCAV
jgi:glutamate-1-semialdehyde 2,1-aminomutase